MKTTEIPVAVLMRVSTDKQNTDRQHTQLMERCQREGWQVVKSFRLDGVSGRKVAYADRSDLTEVRRLAEAGEIKKLLVWDISRIGRRRLETLALREFLTKHGVSIYIHSLGLETLTPSGKPNAGASIAFAVFEELAQAEAEQISERVRSGLAEAARQGRHGGRPPGCESAAEFLRKHSRAVDLLKQGLSLREVERAAQMARHTVIKIKRLLEAADAQNDAGAA